MEVLMMSKLGLQTRMLCIVLVAMLFAGCALSYSVKEPVVSSIQYTRKDVTPTTLTVIDKRTGKDSIFLVKVIGIGGSMSDSVTLKIDNMEDPIGYFTYQLGKELANRGIPVKCVVGETATEGLILQIHRYQIVNIRATGFSPWEACHIFYGTILAGGQEKPIKAYFYNGKVPVWSMNEIEEPCFTIPVSIMIKEVASKINRAVFNLRVPDEKIDRLTAQLNAETGKDKKDPYARPFWEVLELGYSNNPKALEPLKKYAEDSDEFFKSCALSAIGTLGADGQLEFLLRHYRTGVYNDKYLAAKSIGDIGTPKALQILRDMKRDPAYPNEGGLRYCVDLYAP
jgi:hypothetical protein